MTLVDGSIPYQSINNGDHSVKVAFLAVNEEEWVQFPTGHPNSIVDFL